MENRGVLTKPATQNGASRKIDIMIKPCHQGKVTIWYIETTD